MRYTPGKNTKKEKQKKSELYTLGKEYMKKSGENYIGFYKIEDGFATTLDNEDLLKYSEDKDYIKYINLKEFKYLKTQNVKNIKTPPTKQDYERGYMLRYFIKKRNSINSIIYEINEEMYISMDDSDSGINGDLYYGIKLDWMISGPPYDIMDPKNKDIRMVPGISDTNRRIIQLKNKEMPNLDSKLTNFLEYAKPFNKNIMNGN